MTTHELSIRTEWARSHSGQNYIGKYKAGAAS